MNETKRSWFKKKRYILPIIVAAFVVIGSGDTPPVQQPVQNTVAPLVRTVETVAVPSPATETKVQTAELKKTETQVYTAPALSNDNYYTNSQGNQVHSPAYSDSVPAGASAVCRDGTYSFSQSRRGTCSRHGGVAQWL